MKEFSQEETKEYLDDGCKPWAEADYNGQHYRGYATLQWNEDDRTDHIILPPEYSRGPVTPNTALTLDASTVTNLHLYAAPRLNKGEKVTLTKHGIHITGTVNDIITKIKNIDIAADTIDDNASSPHRMARLIEICESNIITLEGDKSEYILGTGEWIVTAINTITKYHISPVNRGTHPESCRYKDSGVKHFSSLKDAEAYLEKTIETSVRTAVSQQ